MASVADFSHLKGYTILALNVLWVTWGYYKRIGGILGD